MKRFKKQTKKELKALAEIARRWHSNYLELAAKLFNHIKAQESEIETLERHLSELRQANFFREAEKKAEPVIYKPKEIPRKFPLAERLTLMQKGSKEWLLALRYNSLTEADAERLIEDWKQTNGNA